MCNDSFPIFPLMSFFRNRYVGTVYVALLTVVRSGSWWNIFLYLILGPTKINLAKIAGLVFGRSWDIDMLENMDVSNHHQPHRR
jgi:hypothetical protein